jgi:hypothetical protein
VLVQDLSWHVFKQTGDIEAYLLYKEMNNLGTSDNVSDNEPGEEDGGSAGEAASP